MILLVPVNSVLLMAFPVPGKRKVWSTRKSCCRPMPRRKLFWLWEAISHARPLPAWSASHDNGDCVPVAWGRGWSGTQWKPLKTSGTPSLPDGLCWHCPEKCRRNCIPRWCRGYLLRCNIQLLWYIICVVRTLFTLNSTFLHFKNIRISRTAIPEVILEFIPDDLLQSATEHD